MFIFCPVRDQLPKHYKDNLLRAKIKYVLFVFKTTPISRAYENTTQTVYKALGSGMARGELHSTLSRATARRSRASRKRLRGYVLTRLLLFVKTIQSVAIKRDL